MVWPWTAPGTAAKNESTVSVGPVMIVLPESMIAMASFPVKAKVVLLVTTIELRGIVQ